MAPSISVNLPVLTGVNPERAATQEIHIFLGPLNPDEETLQRYYRAVEKYNTLYQPKDLMKACFLALVFRDKNGNSVTHKVMQSARYLRCDDTQQVVEESEKDVKFFQTLEEGPFEVLRNKIEATAYGIKQIPQTSSEIPQVDPSSPVKNYFEFHIKLEKADHGNELSDQEIEELKDLANVFSKQFQIPVPFSYNLNQHQFAKDGQGNQRFLNVRFRNMGMSEIEPVLSEINSRIKNTTVFRVVKTISEYVWFDTLTSMDLGWIDYSPEEQQEFLQNLS